MSTSVVEVLAAIDRFERSGQEWTLDTLAAACGVSKQALFQYVTRLTEDGVLKRQARWGLAKSLKPDAGGRP